MIPVNIIYEPGPSTLYHRFDMIEKVKVPPEVYRELVAINREIHYTSDFSQVIEKARDNGYLHAARWLEQNEDAYRRGFARGFEPDPSL